MKIFDPTVARVKVVDEKRSLVNKKVVVVKSLGLGTYIQVDGLTQSGGVVKNIWRSILRGVKREKKEAGNCLILGVGGGTVSRIISKLWPSANQVGVDSDPVMIEFGKKYLGLDDERIITVVDDAGKFVINQTSKSNEYDLVIVDVYVGYDVPHYFTTHKFINSVKKITSKNGIVIFNRLYFDKKRKDAVKFGTKLEKVFPRVKCVYPEANIMFVCHN